MENANLTQEEITFVRRAAMMTLALTVTHPRKRKRGCTVKHEDVAKWMKVDVAKVIKYKDAILDELERTFGHIGGMETGLACSDKDGFDLQICG